MGDTDGRLWPGVGPENEMQEKSWVQPRAATAFSCQQFEPDERTMRLGATTGDGTSQAGVKRPGRGTNGMVRVAVLFDPIGSSLKFALHKARACAIYKLNNYLGCFCRERCPQLMLFCSFVASEPL